MFVFLRIIIGAVLLVSGFEKVLSPYQNFMYVLQAYELFPGWAERLVAMIVPWLELIVGLFIVLGLWLNYSLRAALVLFMSFVIIVAQALLRSLPIDQCGCFGEAVHIPPAYILVFDSFTLLTLFWLIRQPAKENAFSLDQIFNK